jgi:hypothetical protein
MSVFEHTKLQHKLYQVHPGENVKEKIRRFFYDQLPFAACGTTPADLSTYILYSPMAITVDEKLEFRRLRPGLSYEGRVQFLNVRQIHVEFPPGSPNVDKWGDIFLQLQQTILDKYEMLDTVVSFSFSEQYGYTSRWYPPKIKDYDRTPCVVDEGTGEAGDVKEWIMVPRLASTDAYGRGCEPGVDGQGEIQGVPKAPEQGRVSEKTLGDIVEEEGGTMMLETKKRESRAKRQAEIELDAEDMTETTTLDEQLQKGDKMLKKIFKELDGLKTIINEGKNMLCEEGN